MLSKHPTEVEGWEGRLEELAYAIENLSYDRLYLFLHCLFKALEERSKKDTKAKKVLLAGYLYTAATKIADARNIIAKAWKICESHTEKIE